MPIMMLIAVITFFVLLAATVFVGTTLVRGQLGSGRASAEDRRLVEQQMERIELLEAELTRLREQVDFTEKLLEERGRDPDVES